MAIDHSQTYKKLSLRNLPHIMRARSIKNAVKNIRLREDSHYFDVGCSNGYITDIVATILETSNVTGWDHSKENIKTASSQYPKHHFKSVDLNVSNQFTERADMVTCFETIEHVGDINEAVNNIDKMTSISGIILYTVPIESGFIGYIKYMIKTRLFNYSLNEISDDKNIWKKYEKSLLRGDDISVYRDRRNGWSTHFGFDYRNFEHILDQKYNNIKKWSVGTSRFILINK